MPSMLDRRLHLLHMAAAVAHESLRDRRRAVRTGPPHAPRVARRSHSGADPVRSGDASRSLRCVVASAERRVRAPVPVGAVPVENERGIADPPISGSPGGGCGAGPSPWRWRTRDACLVAFAAGTVLEAA